METMPLGTSLSARASPAFSLFPSVRPSNLAAHSRCFSPKDSRRRESACRREGDATFWGGFNLNPEGWLMLMHISKQNGDIKITPK
jgi:hypothetical protein